jgi:hypothetical protein
MFDLVIGCRDLAEHSLVQLGRRNTGRIFLAIVTLLLPACEDLQSPPNGIQAAKVTMQHRIATEAPGDYYIGRRYFKPDFKFWGYVRRPGQPWSMAKLVMLNEKLKLAPDRERVSFGSDNNYEYKLTGEFTGQTVYEPASNGFYPEFLVRKFELISPNPPPIFRSQLDSRAAAATTRLTIEKPEPQL